jgi:erythromycin esterase
MKAICSVLLLLCSLFCKADHFLNLGFEVPILGTDKPKEWYAGGNGYSVHLDTVIKHSGHASVIMDGAALTQRDFGVCTGSFPLEKSRGRTIKYTGFIKTENLTGGWAGLWWRVDGHREGKASVLAFDNMASTGPKGTTSWQEFTVELKVDIDATNINFGCIMAGKGKAWFDDLHIYLDGVKYEDVPPVVKELSDEEMNWLNRAIRPVKTLDLGGNDKDLKSIADATAGAKVVGLGEVTHGSSEIYKMKTRIVKELVEKEGFTIFVIEANMPEAYKINDYIVEGKGDPQELIKGMHFWIWDTKEILDLVNWMKEYNSSHDRKITFAGIDMQFYEGPLDEVNRICSKYGDSDVIKSIKRLEETLKEFNKARKNQEQLSVKEEDYLKNEWTTLRDFSAKKISDKKEQAWLLQNVRLLEQCTEDTWQSRRNEFMAENLLWIKSQNPDSKLIVWAHNAHVQKTSADMGGILFKELKNEYVTIGFTFYQGSYTASGKNGVGTYPAQQSALGSYEYYFHQTGMPMFSLNLRTISKDDPGSKWLFSGLDFRRTGAAPMYNEFTQFDLVNNFDMIVFLDQSSNSTLLHKH